MQEQYQGARRKENHWKEHDQGARSMGSPLEEQYQGARSKVSRLEDQEARRWTAHLEQESRGSPVSAHSGRRRERRGQWQER